MMGGAVRLRMTLGRDQPKTKGSQVSTGKTKPSASAWMTLLWIVAITACSGDNLIDPDTQLVVFNDTDSFQIQSSTLTDITQVLSYTWQTTGVMAETNHSGAFSAGAATLIIRDDAGVEVYRRSLEETGTFSTSQGTSGAWSIEITFERMSGVLNFRVQKP